MKCKPTNLGPTKATLNEAAGQLFRHRSLLRNVSSESGEQGDHLQLAIPRKLAITSRSFVISHRARRPRLCLALQGQHTHLPEKGKEQKIVRFSTGPTAYLTRVRAESVCLPFLLRVMAAPCECGWHCRLTFVRPSTAAATVHVSPLPGPQSGSDVG